MEGMRNCMRGLQGKGCPRLHSFNSMPSIFEEIVTKHLFCNDTVLGY